MNTDKFDLLDAITREYEEVGKLRGPFTEPGWKTPDGELFEYYYRLNTVKEDALMADYLRNASQEGLASFLCMKLLRSDGSPYMAKASAIVLLNRGYSGSLGRVANKIIEDHADIANATDTDLGNS